MVAKFTYKDLEQCLFYLFIQIKQSVGYARGWLPGNIETPEELFNLLKANVTYKNDFPETELLQTMRTLFERNPHGIPGAGDCDCFTITATACCISLNMSCDIVLVGRTKREPVHIYNLVEGEPFDLTEGYFGEKRFYKYKQLIPVFRAR